MSDVKKIGSAGIPLNIVDANGRKIMGDAYDNTAVYAVGDYCISGDHAYKCIVEIETPEDFNTNHWQQITIEEILKEHDASIESINSSLTHKQDTITLTALSNGNYGSFENGGYFTIGNLVIFDVTFTVGSSGATTGQNLITGFPATSQNDKPFFCMMMGSVNNDLKAVRIYQNGLYPNSNFGAGRYHAYGMYIKS